MPEASICVKNRSSFFSECLSTFKTAKLVELVDDYICCIYQYARMVLSKPRENKVLALQKEYIRELPCNYIILKSDMIRAEDFSRFGIVQTMVETMYLIGPTQAP